MHPALNCPRRLRSLSCALALGLACASGRAVAPEQPLRFVAGSVVNLRAEPHERAAVSARVPIATRVKVTQELGDWCQVQVPPTGLSDLPAAGFMRCSLLSPQAITHAEIYQGISTSSGRVQRNASWGPVDAADWKFRVLAAERAFWYSPALWWLRQFEEAQRRLAALQPDEAVTPHQRAERASAPMRQLLAQGFETTKFARLPLAAFTPEPADWRLLPLLDALELRYPGIKGAASFFGRGNQVAALIGAPYLQSQSATGYLAKVSYPESLIDWALWQDGVWAQAQFTPASALNPEDASLAGKVGRIEMRFKGLTGYALSESGASAATLRSIASQSWVGRSPGCSDDGFNVELELGRSDAPPRIILLSTLPISGQARVQREALEPLQLPAGYRQDLHQLWSVDLDGNQLPDLLLVERKETLRDPRQKAAGPGYKEPSTRHWALLWAHVKGEWQRMDALTQWSCRDGVRYESGY